MAGANIDAIKKSKSGIQMKPFKGRVFYKHDKENSLMIINFGKYFEEFGHLYEKYKLSLPSKRVYNMKGAMIAEDNNRILNHKYTEKSTNESGDEVKIKHNSNFNITNEFIYKLLSFKMECDNNSNSLLKLKPEMVLTELMNLISDNLLHLVENFTDKYYIGSMDEIIDVPNHKFGLNTTFMDVDIKQLCHVKYIGNLLIPSVTHYCNRMGKDINVKEFLHNFYTSVFERVSVGKDLKTFAKLHKYTSSITQSSFKSNSIYSRMEIYGNTLDSVIEEAFSKILTTIITRIEPMDTTPAFIAKAIKNITSRYKTREEDMYDVLKGFGDDSASKNANGDSIPTEAERLESNMQRPDELLSIIRKNSASDTIRKIMYEENLPLDDYHEFTYTVNNLDIHKYQTNTIFEMFHTYFGGHENMYDMNIFNYTNLALLASRKLRKLGLGVIADYIMAKEKGYNFQQRWGKSSDRKLFADERYIEVTEKYNSTNILDKNNFIRDTIVYLVNTSFVYNHYNSTRLGNYIKYDEGTIITAVLEYYKLAIK